LRDRGLSWPASFTDDVDGAPVVPELGFAGLATRARPADPDDFVADRAATVALCHPDWRGIRAATLEQTEHVVEVPGFANKSHALRLAGFLRDAGAERVVMNGYPPGTQLLAHALAEAAPQIRFSIVYHGTPALSYGEDVVLQSMIDLYEQGKIFKLGFVKHGLAEYFRFRGVRAEWVMNRCSMAARSPSPIVDGRVNIGVFAPTTSHKNVETQLVAALLVPGSEVHTIEPVKAAYLQAEAHRIHAHGMKPRLEFLELLRTMQGSTYVSLVECYPMTVLESIMSGVICVTSNTSVLFDDAPDLHEALVVAHHDSPAAIAAKLSSAIERREALIPLAQAHLRELNVLAEQRWNEFLEQ
jgi:glycosyltransferase involved in cell wall biosynthesis